MQHRGKTEAVYSIREIVDQAVWLAVLIFCHAGCSSFALTGDGGSHGTDATEDT